MQALHGFSIVSAVSSIQAFRSIVGAGCQSMLDRVRNTIAKSPLGSRLSLLLRNQCGLIVSRALFEGFDPNLNGELWLCKTVVSRIRTFIDVGANLGNWTALFVDSGLCNRRGFLFEPSRYSVTRLTERFRQISDIEIVEAAVADFVGETSFFEGPSGCEQSSLLPSNSPEKVERSVCVTTIDRAMHEREVTEIDIMKIDAEGYDLHVLRGATQMLSRQKIGVIQFEYNSPWSLAGSTLAGARNLLCKCGYEVYLLRRNGLYEMDFDRYGEYFSYSNFVAFSANWAQLLKPMVRGRI